MSHADVGLIVLAALVITVAATGIAFQRRHAVLDDTFIYARMVHNVVAGHGWTYNPGTALDLSTSPLYFLLLLGLSLLTNDVLGGIAILFGATLAATSFLLFLHLRRVTGWVMATLVTVTFLHHPYVLDLNGTEVLLLLALILASLWAYAHGRLVLTAILLSLTVLARGDGLLLAVLLLGHYAIARRRFPPIRLVVAFLILPMAWVALHLAVFHTITATSLQAKMGQGRSGLWILFQSGLWNRFFKSQPTAVWWGGMTCCLLFVPGLLTAAFRRNVGAALLGLTAVLHFVAYSWLEVPDYHWYFGIEFLAVLYVAAIALSSGYRFARRKCWLRLEGGLVVIAWAVMCGILGSVTDFPRAYRFMPAPSAGEYFAVADQIRPFIKPGEALLTPEIGILGWTFPDQTLEDTVGLTGFVSAEELARGQFNSWLARPDSLPENVLLLDRFAGMMLNGDGRVSAHFTTYYEPVLLVKHDNPLFCGTLYRRCPKAGRGADMESVSLLYLLDETRLNPPAVTRMYRVIEGRIVSVLFEHAPNRVTANVEVTSRYLRFGFGLQPEAYDKSDGVSYSLEVKAGGKAEHVFHAEIRPSQNPADRTWQYEVVDLGRFVGQTVELTFITETLENNAFDWSMWLNPRLTDSVSEEGSETHALQTAKVPDAASEASTP